MKKTISKLMIEMKIKNVMLASLIGAGLMYSCGNNDAKEQDAQNNEKGVLEQIGESAEAIKGLSKLEEYTKELESRMNELKAMSPISNDVFKKVLPDTFQGLKRTSLQVGEMSALNLASGKAEYENEDQSKTIVVDIMDGAGEGGASIVSLMFMGMMNDKEEITETGFEKTMDINGTKTMVKEYSDQGTKDSEIQWIHNKRFVVKLEGRGYSLDELTTAFKGLDLTALK
ncbi:hypothetical protein [Sphingobacterium paucimobilis]|uniref:DUF4367 domain-containing protein n=1 Tax=Sphingobacterium paucimobilis HER1398 TaxID=1346330 RepID=U2HXX6_9SPHI|nr:hypothetical protein [Sphingobacterium paucimobilis]ERJ60105.1 hypothetical protein M472_15175 [Sphingobacterium paucimobilis HER1398]